MAAQMPTNYLHDRHLLVGDRIALLRPARVFPELPHSRELQCNTSSLAFPRVRPGLVGLLTKASLSEFYFFHPRHYRRTQFGDRLPRILIYSKLVLPSGGQLCRYISTCQNPGYCMPLLQASLDFHGAHVGTEGTP